MKHLLLASTSTVHGSSYLEYLKPAIERFFKGCKQLLFVPFARPGGITYEEYTANAANFFNSINIDVKGAHEFENPAKAVEWADGFFTGGGNTFLLLKTLYETGFFQAIDTAVNEGKPYMGTSAGSNVAGISIGTTNDMPICYPPTFKAFNWLPFNLNPHYLDPLPDSTHMGETRETRIKEFHQFNNQPVLGLREGSWLECHDDTITLKGHLTARWFIQGKEAAELDSGSII
ncbi:dipeptidase PepE [Polluticaenibacter yanchengensis]|uniref:Dipeptidase PepE n=1 Tax=Polluticaenibacter yanchengensis TaxID=3014562 RepID=A0ABT4UJX9_9BACT|nr:dipeptidase PepE [Chitinophagaceae bacterium LY-5]